MSEVTITFERNLAQRKVDVRLNRGEDEGLAPVPESDIRVKWARLAMRYIQQITEAKSFELNPFVEDTGATLIFSTDDLDDFDEEMDGVDWDDEFEEYVPSIHNFAPESDEAPEGEAIGFGFDYGSAYQRIGGMTTPSVVLAGTVYQLLLRARSRAAQAA